MKSQEELNQAWETISTTPEFEDCLQDLLRYCKFYKPIPGAATDGEHRENSGQRSVVTYILKKTKYPSINIDIPTSSPYEYKR